MRGVILSNYIDKFNDDDEDEEEIELFFIIEHLKTERLEMG